jgi:hypothetical protein
MPQIMTKCDGSAPLMAHWHPPLPSHFCRHHSRSITYKLLAYVRSFCALQHRKGSKFWRWDQTSQLLFLENTKCPLYYSRMKLQFLKSFKFKFILISHLTFQFVVLWDSKFILCAILLFGWKIVSYILHNINFFVRFDLWLEPSRMVHFNQTIFPN